jgi:hypothetical protein
VLPDRTADPEHEAEPTGRNPTDAAGVASVLRFERDSGRIPEERAHNNPGYDIRSRDQSGRVVRHIEVKSIEEAWDGRGMGMSRTQFDFALDNRDTAWLYVVEYALDDSRSRVVRIKDPAGRIEEFRFDDGWSDVDENR